MGREQSAARALKKDQANSIGAEKASSGLTGQVTLDGDEADEQNEHRHSCLPPSRLTQHSCTDGCRSLLCGWRSARPAVVGTWGWLRNQGADLSLTDEAVSDKSCPVIWEMTLAQGDEYSLNGEVRYWWRLNS